VSRPDRAEFFAALDAKLDQGERSYGEKSFDRPAWELLYELEQEAIDLAGWGYVLWERVRRIRGLAEAAEAKRMKCDNGCTMFRGHTGPCRY
jgi:hypothetical protein